MSDVIVKVLLPVDHDTREMAMASPNKVRAVVYPARDLPAATAAWKATLGTGPAWESPDYVGFMADNGVEVGLSRLPWFDHPLVFWSVENIEDAQRGLLASGAVALGEIADGSMAELGTAPITNGDAETGIVSVPGRRLAVVKNPDGTLIGLMQDLPTAW
ncbi:VOC family protein [Actinomadura roseirufa]|uniref:VOC family protein n=1 Tax=Actinomadura roseirufa TaxID=2094049 RepID=UPI001F5FB99D|nr:VOC family protein [Actinomadura roseirufa]